MVIGKHLIAGKWVGSEHTFRTSPYQGIGREFARATVHDVEAAVSQAVAAFDIYSCTSMSTRSSFLNAIASELELAAEPVCTLCCEETGLPRDRIDGELQRSVNQLRYFARYIENSSGDDARHARAQPDRLPLPQPDMRLFYRPVGPVAVFGASNFPLAFSTAGGDTAAALAAGCPVVVKGHPCHPGTADLVAQCVEKAAQSSRVPAGVFSQLQSDTFEVGQALVQHASIKAVGFTGSAGGGRHLFNLCAARPEPIPFYGELGSVNPVFILRGAMAANARQLASQWVTSLTTGAGQLCTNPGVVIVDQSETADRFIEAAGDQIRHLAPQVLLSDSIADSYRQGHDQIWNSAATTTISRSSCSRRTATPALFAADGSAWLANPFLADEVFGPIGIVVKAASHQQMVAIAESLHGQLTCTLHMDQVDSGIAKSLLPILEKKAGRIIVNGFPTGVEVCDAMVHGGPYPASTNFGATSVGSLSIYRFLRPVCYQNMPDDLLATVLSVPESMRVDG